MSAPKFCDGHGCRIGSALARDAQNCPYSINEHAMKSRPGPKCPFVLLDKAQAEVERLRERIGDAVATAKFFYNDEMIQRCGDVFTGDVIAAIIESATRYINDAHPQPQGGDS